jgi:hypothetical protein
MRVKHDSSLAQDSCRLRLENKSKRKQTLVLWILWNVVEVLETVTSVVEQEICL